MNPDTSHALIDTAFARLGEVPGLNADYVAHFLSRNRGMLAAQVRSVLQPLGVRRIVTLNLGLGRDSWTMLLLLIEGGLIAQQTLVRLEDIAAVVFSDTGHEWEHTYQTLPLARNLCQEVGLRFIHIQKPPAEGVKGWRRWVKNWEARREAGDSRATPPWREQAPNTIEERAASGYYHQRAPILEDYQSRETVISINRQDCTSNHKILPIRRLLEDLAFERFGVPTNRAWGLDVRHGERPPHLTLIGYAADEGRRLSDVAGPSYVDEAYPLMELGMTKADEAEVLRRWTLGGFQLNDIRKSGCYICPFQPVSWYWALRKSDPAVWRKVVAYEQKALARNPNMTVMPGRRPLAQQVGRWRQNNPLADVDAVLNKDYVRPEKGRKAKAVAAELPAVEGLPSWSRLPAGTRTNSFPLNSQLVAGSTGPALTAGGYL